MCQMRNVVCLASLLLLSAAASAQQDVINTVAGGGPNNMPATTANVEYPVAVATDILGNYYFAAGHRVFKVDTSGTLTVFAGNGLPGYSGDGGPAAQAELYGPSGIAAYSSSGTVYIYIADSGNCVIREVDSTTGNISTFAGTAPEGGMPQCSYGGDDGSATAPGAYLNEPSGIAVDSSGNVYIADTENFVIREVTFSDGKIHTVAGTGSECSSGDQTCGENVTPTSAGIGWVGSLAVDGSGNVYILDEDNASVREFSVGGDIITVAGSSNGTYCGEYVSGTCGDGGPATGPNAYLSGPGAVAVDGAGNIFIADTEDFRIREVTVSHPLTIFTPAGPTPSTAGYIYDVAGSSVGNGCWGGGVACGDGGYAPSAGLSYVYGVAVDSFDNIFIADNGNLAIREVTALNGDINTMAGNGYAAFAGDNFPATNATLNRPWGATSDSSGDIYIADPFNCIIREVIAATGNITTFAGTPGTCWYGGDGGPATGAQLAYPTKAVAYQGNVYIADTDNCIVRMVDTSGNISTFAGEAPVGGSWHCGYGGDGGSATSAKLSNPYGVAVDSSGNVYIADEGNNRIREVTSSNGYINTVAGNGTAGYWGDNGPATLAELDGPEDVALDAAGNLYIADTYNSVIRMVNPSGTISTLAGGLFQPGGVAVDAAGDVLIADTFHQRIRWVDGQGSIYTVAGISNHYGFSGDGGLATGAELGEPQGVGVDPSGNIYVGDTENSRVRKVNAVAGLNASSTNVTFAPQYVTSTSNSQTVTLSAVGPLDVSSIDTSLIGDFSESGGCTTGSPVPWQSCVMSIEFKPTATGSRTGTITIHDNAFFGAPKVINLKGTGTSTEAALSPSPLGFAAQDGNTTSVAKTLTLSNYLSIPLTTISIPWFTGANPNDFAQPGSTCGRGPLLGNSTCTFSITFKPSVNGAESATFDVSDSNGTQTATLSGTGIGAALATSPLVFACQGVGTTSAAQTLTLSNYLSSALTISSAAIGGANPGDFAIQRSSTCPHPSGSLKANSNCTYNITFKPSLKGAESATLSISDADGTQTATLTGTGLGAVLAPSTLVFAAQNVGTTSAAKTLTLTNYLSSTLRFSAALGGANPGDFAVQRSSTCGFPTGSLAGNVPSGMLLENWSCTYRITFKPSLTGPESATFTVTDADGTQTATLSGTGK